MRKILCGLPLSLISILLLASVALAGDSGGQPITIEVAAIDEELESAPGVYLSRELVTPDSDGNYIFSEPGEYALTADPGAKGNIIIYAGDYWLGGDFHIEGSITVLGGSFNSYASDVKCDGFFVGVPGGVLPVTVDISNSRIECFAFAVRNDVTILITTDSQIITTLLFDSQTKSGRQYHDVVIRPSGTVYGFVEGNSTFNNLDFQAENLTYLSGILDVSGEFINEKPIHAQRLEANRELVFEIITKELTPIEIIATEILPIEK